VNGYNYAVIGSPINCAHCGIGGGTTSVVTPNDVGLDTNGDVDAQLMTIAHEVNELMTDTRDYANGWNVTFDNLGSNTQMADFCNTRFEPYDVAVGGGQAAKATFSANGNNYVLPWLRVNPYGNDGSLGYCVSSYGGPFWLANFGYSHSPIGDWQYGSLKGECVSGQPLIGVSTGLGQKGAAHAMLCGNLANSSNVVDSSIFSQGTSCQGLHFTTSDVRWYNDNSWDWDYGFVKGECGQNQFAAGVSQTANFTGNTNGLLCCPGRVATHSSTQCQAVAFDSANVTDYDWDLGYSKAQCPNGKYVAGISTNAQSVPHRMLCCSP
jgi:hypothetical protein